MLLRKYNEIDFRKCVFDEKNISFIGKGGGLGYKRDETIFSFTFALSAPFTLV